MFFIFFLSVRQLLAYSREAYYLRVGTEGSVHFGLLRETLSISHRLFSLWGAE